MHGPFPPPGRYGGDAFAEGLKLSPIGSLPGAQHDAARPASATLRNRLPSAGTG
jgi:hypothetical protein